MMPARRAAPRLPAQLTCLADVEHTQIQWLWPGRIPLGKIAVLDGDPGLGKSTVTLDIAARVSTSEEMPDGSRSECGGPAGVVLLSAEDDPSDTIRPRLDAAGADVSRVYLLTALGDGSMPTLKGDGLRAIAYAIEETTARLVIIDPLMAYLGSADSHRDQEIRQVLAPLAELARQKGAAIIMVRHLNKRSGGNALYRGGGSIGIIGTARAGLLIARDPDDSDRRILAMTKMNVAREVPALAYRIDGCSGIPRIVWEGHTDHTAARLLAEPTSREDGHERSEAMALLRDMLATGPAFAKEIQRSADGAGISRRTLSRAKAELGVRSRKQGKSWIWELPGVGSKDANPQMTAPLASLT